MNLLIVTISKSCTFYVQREFLKKNGEVKPRPLLFLETLSEVMVDIEGWSTVEPFTLSEVMVDIEGWSTVEPFTLSEVMVDIEG